MVFLVDILKVHNVRFNANSIFCWGHSIFRFTFFVQSDQKTKKSVQTKCGFFIQKINIQDS